MKCAFLFPGQGSQYVGMGKNLCENFRAAAHVFEEAEEALKLKLKRLCFDGLESDLKLTEHTQPAILTVSVAAYKVLSAETDILPVLVAGHSLGEYTALVVIKALSFLEAVCAVRERGRAMQNAVPVGKGAMAALVGGESETVKKLCHSVNESVVPQTSFVSPANFNGAGQVVISGTADAVEKAVALAPTYGIRYAKLLDVSAPFHCKLMEPAAVQMKKYIEQIEFRKPMVPYIANVDGQIHADAEGIADRLIRQIPNPVLWEDSMNILAKENIETVYEIGPGKVLTSLLRRINKNIQCLNVEMAQDIKQLTERKKR